MKSTKQTDSYNHVSLICFY